MCTHRNLVVNALSTDHRRGEERLSTVIVMVNLTALRTLPEHQRREQAEGRAFPFISILIRGRFIAFHRNEYYPSDAANARVVRQMDAGTGEKEQIGAPSTPSHAHDR